jgi:hypothetical protein
MAMQAISVSLSWAIAQYQRVGAALRGAASITPPSIRPKDPPQVIQYLRAIGIGRNVDVYA